MAGQIAVCNAILTQSSGVLSCSEPWVFAPAPPSDLSDFIGLFTFDVGLFGELTGICVLLFVLGHSAGHVARNLGRV